MRADLIVIGGGICGLTRAYKYLKKHKGHRVIVIEKGGVIGGRARQMAFAGTLVPGGAGVGRVGKDRKLMRLMKEFGLPVYKFPTVINYYGIDRVVDVLGIVDKLRSIWKRRAVEDGNLTFQGFFRKHLGADELERFIDTVGYTDYLETNIYDALYNYGFDDTVNGVGAKFAVPWNELLDRLGDAIKAMGGEIWCEASIVSGDSVKKEVEISRRAGKEVVLCKYDKMVIAAPPAGLKKERGVRSMISRDVVEYVEKIRGQPFCYVYGVVDKEFGDGKKFIEIMGQGYTVVPRPIQKIIPMNAEKGVFMLAYNDGESARRLKGTVKGSADMERLIKECLNFDVRIKKILVKYWDVGTHYRGVGCQYRRIEGLAGEAYALNQGWTNGGI